MDYTYDEFLRKMFRNGENSLATFIIKDNYNWNRMGDAIEYGNANEIRDLLVVAKKYEKDLIGKLNLEAPYIFAARWGKRRDKKESIAVMRLLMDEGAFTTAESANQLLNSMCRANVIDAFDIIAKVATERGFNLNYDDALVNAASEASCDTLPYISKQTTTTINKALCTAYGKYIVHSHFGNTSKCNDYINFIRELLKLKEHDDVVFLGNPATELV